MAVGSTVRRLSRISLYLALTLTLMPAQGLLLAARSRLARRLPIAYHGLCCRILGFRLSRHGERSRAEPTLFVANHTSYMDIAILGAAVEGSFVAKAEVARWPLFGWLAKLQRSVFVDRRIRSTRNQRDAIRDRLGAGDSLILFPEGTSGDGIHVLPFKSALFAAADLELAGVPLVVQPISVALTRLDGMPLGRYHRPFFAWYGDMSLAPHLWTMLGLGTVDVALVFHPTVTLATFGSRKALAEHCERVVAEGVANAIAGRLKSGDPVALVTRVAGRTPAVAAGAS